MYFSRYNIVKLRLSDTVYLFICWGTRRVGQLDQSDNRSRIIVLPSLAVCHLKLIGVNFHVTGFY